MRRIIVAVGLTACFTPIPPTGAPCNPATDDCPSGQVCAPATSGGHRCTSRLDDMTDAKPPGDDAPMLADGQTDYCFGTGLVSNICFTQAPAGTITVGGTTQINTATIGSGNCTLIVAQSGGPSLCVVAAQTIDIPAGATLSATGPNPLVLIATQNVVVGGTLDVASKRAGAIGAGVQSSCGTGIDGNDGQQNVDGGGGGAGGTFGAAGGNGGRGRGAVQGGVARQPSAISFVIGGCPGGRGGAGGQGGEGAAASGGGAVYVIAGASIAIGATGKINASGAGGGPGGAGANASGGAGGGGSGGLIGLDAPAIANTGSVLANGGGGGGGGGDQPSAVGQPGNDANNAGTAASGGSGGGGGGGRGGNGAFSTTTPQNGSDGTGDYCGGGGGGGGRGEIRVFQGTLGGTVSPPPS